MVSINEMRNRARWQILLLVLMCTLFVFAVPAHASPYAGTQCEVTVIARPNMPGNPNNQESNKPFSNQLSHVIPVAFGISGIVLAITFISQPVLAVVTLIVTVAGTITLNQLLGALW